jgi:hypothetical protein
MSITNKEWFIKVTRRGEIREEGPYSVAELSRHPDVTRTTLVWREGMEIWLPLYKVPELKLAIFGEERTSPPPQSGEESEGGPLAEVLLAVQPDPPHFLFWLLMALMAVLLLLSYVRDWL